MNTMKRVSSVIAAVAGLTLTLGVAPSWAGPPNNDVSDANGNTAGGTNALLNTTTGFSNTGFGFEALRSNTTGSSNTAFGLAALQFNTTGSTNTASGAFALFRNTTGDRNTASGFEVLGANTTGNNNTASGVQALQNNTTGSNNIALGRQASFWRAGMGTSTSTTEAPVKNPAPCASARPSRPRPLSPALGGQRCQGAWG